MNELAQLIVDIPPEEAITVRLLEFGFRPKERHPLASDVSNGVEAKSWIKDTLHQTRKEGVCRVFLVKRLRTGRYKYLIARADIRGVETGVRILYDEQFE